MSLSPKIKSLNFKLWKAYLPSFSSRKCRHAQWLISRCLPEIGGDLVIYSLSNLAILTNSLILTFSSPGLLQTFFFVLFLTNRFHDVIGLFSNRSKMTSKCGKSKNSGWTISRVRHWCSYHILTLSMIYYWTDARQRGVYLFHTIKKEEVNSDATYASVL